jgi:hypothetical protein
MMESERKSVTLDSAESPREKRGATIMRRVVSVSLGASSGDMRQEAEFLGERFQVEREGTDGDLRRAIARIAELDGNVDAIGLGGIDLYLVAGGRRYVVREAARMAAAARRTPIVDGSGLKHTLERETIRRLQREGVIDFRGRRVLMVAAVDRFGMAEALVEAGADVLFGDLIYGLGVPVPIRTLAGLNRLARILLPIIRLLPIAWIYPTGKQQERRVVRAPQHYHWAEVIAGDGHLIRRFLPDGMEGQTVITNTVRRQHVELFRQCGISRLITTTQEFNGQSFGTNAMEGVLLTLLRERGLEPTPEKYLEMLEQLGWRPGIVELRDETSGKS